MNLDAAIEAAAKSLWDHRELTMVDKGYECYCGERVSEGYAIAPSKGAHARHQALAAVTAAEPVIREAIAQDIYEELHPGPNHLSLELLNVLDEVAQIVRGGSA